MKPSIRLFKVGGVEIGIHYTWVFAFILISWSLANGVYPDWFSGWTQTEYWVSGVVSALVLFGSVLVHELAHSFMAKRKGLPVKGITLFIFGGVSNIGAESRKAWDEFVIAVVGPLSSVLIGIALFTAWAAMQPDSSVLLWDSVGSRAFRNSSPLEGVVFYSAYINIAVGVFNLIPAFPLDGGRVLRSVMWGATGSLRRATDIAATVGRLFGWGLIGYGLFLTLQGEVLSGIWVAFIGWFLSSAADSPRRNQEAEYEFAGSTVRDVMKTDPVTVSAEMPVDELVRECFIRRGCRAAPVVDAAGDLVGIVSLTDVRRVGMADWAGVSVASVMTREPLHTLSPGDDLDAALKLLAENEINQAVVLDGGRVLGLVSREGLMRFVRLRRELHVRG